MRDIIYKALLLFFLYLPFQLAINPAEGVDLASIRIIIILLFLFWTIDALRRKKVLIPFNLQSLFVLSFLYLSAFSLVYAENWQWSIRKIAFLFSIFPLYFIIPSTVLITRQRILRIFEFSLWGAAIAAGIGLFQFLLQFVIGIDSSLRVWAGAIRPFLGSSFTEAVLKNPSWLVNAGGFDLIRVTSFFPDPHMLSFYLGMLLPFAIAFYIIRKQKIFLFIFALLLVADFLTFSRGGYVGVFSGAIFSILYLWKNFQRKHKKIILSASLLILIIIALPNPVSKRFLSSFDLGEGSNIGRIETWKSSLEVIKNNALAGTGIGNYALEIKPSADYREPIYSHNLYLDIFSEIGILGIIAWLGIITSSFLSFLKKSHEKNKFSPLGWAGITSLVIFSTHSLFETALFSTRVLPLLILIIALSLTNPDEIDN